MGLVAAKWRRLREAASVARHGVDLRSRRTLFGCYLRLLAGGADESVVRARIRFGRVDREFSFRRNDIFTLGEVLFEGQYRMRADLPERPTIIDGGANIGVAASWMLGERPGAHLHAFEPEPGNFALLSTNLGGVEGVVLNQAAIGATEMPVRLHLATHGAEHSIAAPSPGARSIEVPCHRLDGYMQAHGIATVDLLKLDVEGSEADVVAGLGDRIHDVRAIVGEFHETLVREEDFYGRLQAAGFEVRWRARFPSGNDGVHAFEMHRRGAWTSAS